MTVKDLVKKDNIVRFKFYRKGELWYDVIGTEELIVAGGSRPLQIEPSEVVLYTFPVPISDCGDGTFLNQDKAITFMRYIRKQLEVDKPV